MGRRERELLAPGAAGGEEILFWGSPAGTDLQHPLLLVGYFGPPGPDPGSGLVSLVGLEATIFSRRSGREENYL